MTKMTVAARAAHRRPFPAETAVACLDHVFLRDRLPEAGPSRARVELRRRIEQRRVTGGTAIKSRYRRLLVCAAEGALSTVAAHHVVRIVGKTLVPLRIVEHELAHMAGAEVMTVDGETFQQEILALYRWRGGHGVARRRAAPEQTRQQQATDRCHGPAG